MASTIRWFSSACMIAGCSQALKIQANKMKITVLGSGTSTGVPQVGCTCQVCLSSDARDKRLRCSSLFETDTTRVLLDCSPDFREQSLHISYQKIDGILVTHEHYDHVGGIDDLRPFCRFGDIDIFGEADVNQKLRERLPYCFRENLYPGVPKINLRDIEPGKSFKIGDIQITPIRVMHGKLPIVGYRLNNVVYITDMTTFPEEGWPIIRGCDVLLENALRYEAHPSHQTVSDAIQFAEKLGCPRTYLIHMCHSIGLHAQVDGDLPSYMHLTFDGMTIEA